MILNKIAISSIKRNFSNEMTLKIISSSKCHEGEQRVYSHKSKVLNCEMKFGVYMPPAAIKDHTICPVLFYLSGLTSNHEKFINNSGMQYYASKYGIVVVNPDTTPRGANIPGEEDDHEFGVGAGFYIDATLEPWSKHYQMYCYITQELPELINANLPVEVTKKGIFGHSMGGHGALICALRNPDLFQSISAFAPVANAMKSIVARKSLNGFLGPQEDAWLQYDATRLAEKYTGRNLEIFIDQGSVDEWAHELLTENFVDAAAKNEGLKVNYKIRDGYDHSYFHINTFIGEHISYHANILKA